MKKVINITPIIICILLLSACGPSKEKILEAQATYKELVNTHNQVVEAYAAIDDNGLDNELRTLSTKVDEFADYNLYDMKDEDIDILIKTMSDLNSSYSDYLKTIGEIRITEEEAVLNRIGFSVCNESGISIDTLSLMEEGESDLVSDALMDRTLRNGQYLEGLAIYRDVDMTPWVLMLSYSDGDIQKEEIIVLDESLLDEDGSVLYIKYNANREMMYLEKLDNTSN